MRCENVTNKLEAYLDGELDSAQVDAIQSHLASCEPCQRQLEVEQQWLDAFRELPAPTLSRQQADDLLAGAHARYNARYRRPAPWIGGAIAASLVLGLALTVSGPGGEQEPLQVAQQDHKAPAEMATGDVPVLDDAVRTVRLAFNAQKPMKGVTLTLEFPPHAELEPYPGQQRLSWEVDLDEGKNVLALPMRVLYPDDGEIIAQLQYGEQRSTFTAPVPHWGKDTNNDADTAM